MKKFIEEVTEEAKALKVKISEDIDDIKVIFNFAALKNTKDKIQALTKDEVKAKVKSGINIVGKELKAMDSKKIAGTSSKFINGTAIISKNVANKAKEMTKGEYESTGLNFIVSSAKSISNFLTLSEFNNQVKRNHTLKVGLAMATVSSLAASIMFGNPLPYILTKSTFNYKMFNDLIKHHKKEDWTNSAGQTLTSSVALKRYLLESEDKLVKIENKLKEEIEKYFELEEKMEGSKYFDLEGLDGKIITRESVEKELSSLELDKVELAHNFNKTYLKAKRLSKQADIKSGDKEYKFVSPEGLNLKRAKFTI